MPGLDILMLAALVCIWGMLLLNTALTIAGYVYYVRTEKRAPEPLAQWPFVSVLVPAHNEGLVIERTVRALLRFDYPADRYEIIVINDNSSDNSREILEALRRQFPERHLQCIHTDKTNGGKGKSNALNIGLSKAKGSVLAIYDADNTPERPALRLLVSELMPNPELGAVIGKFRTRNKDRNLLTRFINIETLAFQWMAQAGRWQLLGLCTIPGTNFVIRRDLLEQMGGWDENALAEDTEISFRLYQMGYRIKFLPQAVTWEQEPQTVGVWFKQRTRWVKGNVYVVLKNFPQVFSRRSKRYRFDILYFSSVYVLLLGSLLASDILFLGNAFNWTRVTLAGFSPLLWLMAIVLFVVGTYLTLITEKGEITLSNLFTVVLMYFTYSKMWMIVAAWGVIQYLLDLIFHRRTVWVKTVRFQ